jgi:ABC-type transporter Mla MlaB component
VSTLGPPPGPRSIVLVFGAPIAPGDVPALCEQVRLALEARRARVVLCDVRALREADVATVDALARLQLTARRLGGKIRLLRAPAELRALIAFVGLSGVLDAGGGSGARTETEEREEALGVEKRVQRDDPAV